MSDALFHPELTIQEITRSGVSCANMPIGEQTVELLRWWQSYSPRLPHRNDFDPVDHRALANSLFLVRQIEKNCFEYRINAEEVSNAVGRVPMGVAFSTESPHDDIAELARYYQMIIDQRQAYICKGILKATGGDLIPFEAIDCPLLGESGNPSYILGAFMTYPEG